MNENESLLEFYQSKVKSLELDLQYQLHRLETLKKELARCENSTEEKEEEVETVEIVEIKNYHNEQSAFFKIYENCYICNILKQNLVWEPYLHEIFKKHINSQSVVLEAGTHIGTHSILLSQLCSKIFLFEPLKSSFLLLKENLNLNNCQNAVVYNMALGERQKSTEFSWITDNNVGASGLKDNPMGDYGSGTGVSVQVTTIDHLNLEKLDFVKLDAEGYEPLIIQGAMATIRRFKPIITLECWKDHNGHSDLNHTANLYQDLLSLGYNLRQIEHSDYLFWPK